MQPLFARRQVIDETIHPRVVHSKSDEYELKLNPSDMTGRFAAEYTLRLNKKSLWAKEFPVTLREVAVTNSGSIVGYGYTHGLLGLGNEPQSGEGDFVVAVIDRNGKTILWEKHERTDSRWIHGIPDPKARGMVVDEANDRMIVRVSNPDPNVRDEQWWIFRISDGGTYPELEPQLQTKSDLDPYLIHVRPVNGTSLLLVQWWLYRYPNKSIGTMFTLHDENGLEVWSKSLPDDYIGKNEAEQEVIRNRIISQGALLDNEKAKSFSLLCYSDKAKVDFVVGQNSEGNWDVREQSRQPFDMANIGRQNSIVPEAWEHAVKINSKYETVDLKPTKVQPKHPIRNIGCGFDFDSQGNIGFIQHESEEASNFLRVDMLGKTISTFPLDVNLPKDSNWSGIAYVGGDTFVATMSASSDKGKSTAYRIDAKKKSVTRLSDFSSPPVTSIAGCTDGCFVVLSDEDHNKSVTKHDATGLKLWTIGRSYENYPKTVFSPESLCVSDVGEVLVLDNIKKQIQVFDSSGSFSRLIELESCWEREPNYPVGIASSPDQDILVYDFGGKPSLIVMDPSGLPKYSFDAKQASDRPALSLSSQLKVDSEGRVWITDVDTIMRLGRDGVVDRVLGEIADDAALGDIGAISVDRKGNIAAQSRKTKVVHLFDRVGKFQRTIRDDSLRDSNGPTEAISIGPNGDVYVNTSNNYENCTLVRFSAEGQKLDTLKLDYGRMKPLGNAGQLLYSKWNSLRILSASGEFIRKIDRQPDGNWMEDISGLGVAENGDFAVATSHLHSLPKLPNSVNLFSAKGDPVRTIVVPDSHGLKHMDYDGTSLVLCGEKEICVYNSLGLEQFRIDYPVTKQNAYWDPTLTQQGSELVLVDYATYVIYRIALPK